MIRVVVFVCLLAGFVVWTFPHRLLVERVLERSVADLGVDVALGDVRMSWPPGYRVEDVTFSRGGYGVTLDALQFDLHLDGATRFDGDGCGGSLRGSIEPRTLESGDGESREESRRLELTFTGIDPSQCMRLDTLSVSGRFGGTVLVDSPRAAPGGGKAASGNAEATVEASAGTISGQLPGLETDGKRTGPGQPIGEWEFAHADLHARLDGADLVLETSSAQAEGVEWKLVSASLKPDARGRYRLTGDLRARRLDDTARSKAVIGLMPRATEAKDGWRRYRLSGSLDAPKIIGLK